jgi:nitric oxide reductase subunit B
MWGRHTNLAVVEYWRWWVVHLWVEGFEVFATVVLALFTRLGLLATTTATRAVLFSTILYLAGGYWPLSPFVFYRYAYRGACAWGESLVR